MFFSSLNAPAIRRFGSLAVVVVTVSLSQLAAAEGNGPSSTVEQVSFGSLPAISTSSCTSCGKSACGCETRAGAVDGGGAMDGGMDLVPDAGADLGGDVVSSSNFGASSGGFSSNPAMIGDFFGSFLSYDTYYGYGSHATLPIAGGDRRFKIAENVSPMPQDRVFYNYNYFNNALVDIDGGVHSLNRHTFGIEKTALDGNVSFELRIPFAGALSSDQTSMGGSANTDTEFGNIGFAIKGLLCCGESYCLSAGFSGTLPTGDDFRQFENFGTPTLTMTVENQSVHLAPFLGFVWQPNGMIFTQTFVQFDFDLNGNDVVSHSMGRPTFEGVIQEQHLMFVDTSVGIWLVRDVHPWLRGIAAMAELHYTTTMNDTDDVIGIRNPLNRVDVLNATGGFVIDMGSSMLRIASAAPLREGDEALFDSEVMVQFTRRY